MIHRIAEALAAHGLILRGGFAFEPGEEAPALSAGRSARAVLLVGHGGGSIWPDFTVWRAAQRPDLADPLDTWARTIIREIAGEVGARAVHPSDRPFMPFQKWAIRAEGLQPSPLGILMHPSFGLWHAYRGALLFDDPNVAGEIAAANRGRAVPAHPCDSCAERPCLRACPVSAHSAAGFDYPGCLSHVRSAAGHRCATAGCLDRNACPVATEHRYPAVMQDFLMTAFAR
jgi:hypothetical protein